MKKHVISVLIAGYRGWVAISSCRVPGSASYPNVLVVQSSILIVYAVIPVDSDIWGRVEGRGANLPSLLK